MSVMASVMLFCEPSRYAPPRRVWFFAVDVEEGAGQGGAVVRRPRLEARHAEPDGVAESCRSPVGNTKSPTATEPPPPVMVETFAVKVTVPASSSTLSTVRT
jgi:hypothetical protein